MLTLLRKILFIEFVFFFFIVETFAQKNNSTQKSEFEKTHPQKIPEGVLSSREEIINYFVNEKKDVKSIVFIADNSNKREEIHIDSLLPKFKEYVEAFIKSKSRQSDQESEYLKNKPIEIIYKKVKVVSKKAFKDRSKNELAEILNSINILPDSKEKVGLLLKYADLTISNETYYEDVVSICLRATEVANLISDLYEQGKACNYIGDFASHYKIDNVAVQLYYFARECFENCTKDTLTKFNEQAFVCNKLAYLFLWDGVAGAQAKASDYFRQAYHYFHLANNVTQANISYTNSDATDVYMWTDFPQYFDPYSSKQLDEKKLETFRNLKHWYLMNKKVFDMETNYLCYYSIGTILRGGNMFKEALIYYLHAFTYAANGESSSQLEASLNFISLIYSLLGQENLAIGYADLSLYLAEQINDRYGYYNAILDKADRYSLLKRYDSAFVYVNRFQADTTLAHRFYPSFYNELLAKSYEIKYGALYFNKSDSAPAYQGYSLFYKTQTLESFASLLESESRAASGWLERSKDRAISSEKELEKTLEKNLQIKASLLDAETKSNILNKALADSSERLRAKEGLVNADIIRQEKQRTKDQEQNTLEQKKNAHEQKVIRWWITGVAIATVGLLIGMLLFFRKVYRSNLKRSEELKRKKSIELKQLDELARNKIHNFQNDYHILANMLNDGEIEKAKLYTTAWGTYQAHFLENWKRDTVTLEDELILLEQYCNVKRAMGQMIVFDKNHVCKNVNPQKVLFTKAVFDTLLDNSVRRGFKEKSGICQFDVKVERKGEFLFCVIADNGIPPKDSNSYFRREDSGLNILKSRIRGMFELKDLIPPEGFFTAEILPNNSGTVIKIILPYEQFV